MPFRYVVSFSYNKFTATTWGGEIMQMSEVARLIIGLREKGWTEEEINNFILWIETGEDKYKPTKA